MQNQEVMDTKASLDQVHKVCQRLRMCIKIVFAIVCFFWAVSAISMIWTLACVDISGGGLGANIFNLMLHIARGAVVLVLYLLLLSMFNDAILGEPPFTMKQVRRLKTASLALIFYAILGVILGCCSALLQMNGFSSGYVSSFGESDNVIMSIDLAPFITAAVVFAFSYVFKYGVLLQELSDETL